MPNLTNSAFTVTAYGPKQPVEKLRKLFDRWLKDEAPDLNADERAACCVSKEALEAQVYVRSTAWDAEPIAEKKPTKSAVALQVTTPLINERLTREWVVDEWRMAKGATVLVEWTAPNGGEQHQVIFAGEQVHESR